jgi:hypothetical protein
MENMQDNASDTLKKENELVELLAAVAKVFAEQRAVTPLDKLALGAWAPDLLRHRDINQQLIDHAENDRAADFDAMATQELDVLARFIDGLDPSANVIEHGFSLHFQDDRQVLMAMV